MKELTDMAITLTQAIDKKEAELEESGSLNATQVSLIQNRKRNIQFFKDRVAKVADGPGREKVIQEFKARQKEILRDIQDIK